MRSSSSSEESEAPSIALRASVSSAFASTRRLYQPRGRRLFQPCPRSLGPAACLPPVRTYRQSSRGGVPTVSRLRGEASPYDAIAELYDPWSRSVVEDVGFYVEEALRARPPVVELGVGADAGRLPRTGRARGRRRHARP